MVKYHHYKYTAFSRGYMMENIVSHYSGYVQNNPSLTSGYHFDYLFVSPQVKLVCLAPVPCIWV